MQINTLETLRKNIRSCSHMAEDSCVQTLILINPIDLVVRQRAEKKALALVDQCRRTPEKQTLLDAFLQEYRLSTQEGIALMCLAEALLRVPDSHNRDRLIAEKIHSGNWSNHRGKSSKLFVNAITWGLMLTGQIVHGDTRISDNPDGWPGKLVSRVGEAAVRTAVFHAMKIMGRQYVLGATIDEALKRGPQETSVGTRFSFDMLGEGARTFADAKKYFDSYMKAIQCIGEHKNRTQDAGNIYSADGISVKLTALHPRYEFSQREQVLNELVPLAKELALQAKQFNIGFSIDAEEAARLDIELDVFQALAFDPELADWNGLGFVLQAYQKRALKIINWLVALAQLSNRRLMVRLVKGAYWDAEIKHAQELGLTDYPVFTRKSHTDLNYQVCAARLLANNEFIFPQFATHNAYTLALILELAGKDGDYEFQRLHGMGALLYDQLAETLNRQLPLRVYAPVGLHRDLLPYLVRRLLENGANASFVSQFLNNDIPATHIVAGPETVMAALPGFRHSGIPIPEDLYISFGEPRKNSRGIDLDAPNAVDELYRSVKIAQSRIWQAGPIIDGQMRSGTTIALLSPANKSTTVGYFTEANNSDAEAALNSAHRAQPAWQERNPDYRARALERAANLMEERTELLAGLISLEAGRTLGDGIAEVREAVDFCRYYALQIRRITSQHPDTPSLAHGRGVFVCISPWNFPLAIFVGQIAAALVTGNSVIAKPAEQTPLVAAQAVEIFHEAGVPGEVLHLLPGSGQVLGRLLLADSRVAGVAFTGSTETAKCIETELVKRGGTLPPLIAETGGQNVMLVDSTALPEQVVDDVISSAFLSAGQRCSALRVVFVQEEIADGIINMLKGALQTLTIGEPWELDSDIGPVIDDDAVNMLHTHIDRMHKEAIFIGKTPIRANCPQGTYIEPHVFELNSITQLTSEVFGPILHIIRYRTHELDIIFEQINATGYGLTLGVHSRIAGFADEVFAKTHVGNTYINRNMVGAVVGVNPFGGHGLSGTGFKAGGPHYLLRFCGLWQDPTVEGIADTADEALGETATHCLCMAKNAQWAWNRNEGKGRYVQLTRALADLADSKLNLTPIAQQHGQALLDEANRIFTGSTTLPGPTGEINELSLHGRGVFLVYISDSDLDDAVLRSLAALAAGNAILLAALTLEDADLAETIRIWLQRFIPADLIAVITSRPQISGLITHQDIAGIAAQKVEGIIARLACRQGSIIPLVTSCPSGPFALLPYAVEKTKTNNLVATGGNTFLLNLPEG